LPLRRPGDLLLPGSAAEEVTTDLRPADGPDPDLVRARLAGLATGIAAAHRQLALEQPST
jgi:hypothetical protein